MPTTSRQAGVNQLQRMLEQMYKSQAQNASPRLREDMEGDAVRQAAIDAGYSNYGAVGTGSHMPPGGYPQTSYEFKPPVGTSRHALPTSLYRQAVGTSRHFPGPDAYNVDPNAKARDVALNTRRGELNTLEDRLGAAREASRARSMSTPVDPLTDIESKIAALAGKPDIPGQWISPYSQDYLNQLGDRLGQAGGAAQQAFGEAKNQIAADYQGGIDQRTQSQGALTAALQGNGQNIGVDYAKSLGGQQAAQDMNYLSQVANVNQASDLATNDKLGVIANQTGSNLGMQAREGLLTPKQWQEGRSGLSGGDNLMADFLMNKYNQELGTRSEDKRLAADAANSKASAGSLSDMFKSSLTEKADENYSQSYPDLVQAMGRITDPGMRDEVDRIWGSNSDPSSAVGYLQSKYLEENPNIFGKIALPPASGGHNPATQRNVYAMFAQKQAEQQAQQQQYQTLLEFFKRFDPKYTGTRTGVSTSNSSTTKYGD